MKEEKITLTLSADYLEHWTIYDALRELYQNVFDRAEEDSPNAKWFSGTVKSKTIQLSLGNLDTGIDRKTLILGVTSKRDNRNAIGKFGEGYKLAILVLLRNKIDVQVTTWSEIWTFKLEHNEQFDTEMLTIYIEKSEHINEDLTFLITGIPKKVWSSYSQYNLKLQKNLKVIETAKCNVLTDERNRSKIFIGGLYICKYIGTSIYGYDFHPNVFELGRDRNIVEGFNANWQASKALTQATIENLKVMELVIDNITESDDTRYISSFADSSEVLLDAMWTKFITAYPDTLPVWTEWNKKYIQRSYLNVQLTIVKEREYEILVKSDGYKRAFEILENRPPAPTPLEIVNRFYDEYGADMSDSLRTAYAQDIMTEAVNWIISS